MLSTLILLYALDAGQIPLGCYVAAWSLTGIKLIAEIIKMLINIQKDKNQAS